LLSALTAGAIAAIEEQPAEREAGNSEINNRYK